MLMTLRPRADTARSYPKRRCRISDVAAVTRPLPIARARTTVAASRPLETSMLWLIIGIVLLIIAVAGGAIVHPILFVLAILALVAFFAGSRGRAL